MQNEPDDDKRYSPYIERIQEIGEIQQKMADLSPDAPESEIDEIFNSFPSDSFLTKTKFCNIFQACVSNLFFRSKRERITLLFLNKMKDQIRHFFQNDEVHLLKIADPHIFLDEWFLENGFISITTIVKESEFDLKLSQYFLPEIIETNPSYFYDFLRVKYPNSFKNNLFTSIINNKNQNSDHTEINFTKEELDDIKKRRRNQIIANLNGKTDFESCNSYDPIPLRCCLMSDDIDRFQSILSNNNLSINSICQYSVYDPILFPNNYIAEKGGRSLIEAAASFGSVNIFKFLLINKAKFRKKEIFRRAIFGGNYDIFHMIENTLMMDVKVLQVTKKQFLKLKEEKEKKKLDENKNQNSQKFSSDAEQGSQNSSELLEYSENAIERENQENTEEQTNHDDQINTEEQTNHDDQINTEEQTNHDDQINTEEQTNHDNQIKTEEQTNHDDQIKTEEQTNHDDQINTENQTNHDDQVNTENQLSKNNSQTSEIDQEKSIKQPHQTKEIDSNQESHENTNETKIQLDDSDPHNEDDDDEDSSTDELVSVLDETVEYNKKIRLMFQYGLKYAIKYGRDEIMEYMLDNYSDLFDLEITADSISERIVNFCMINFKETFFPLILQKPNDLDKYDNTYLISAAHFNYSDLVHLLLLIPGIDLNYVNSRNGQTALSSAVEQNSIKAVKVILKSPLFKYSYEKTMEVTPFTNAASHGYIDEIMIFINFKKEIVAKYPFLNKNKKNKHDQYDRLKTILDNLQYFINNNDEDDDDVYYFHEEDYLDEEEEEDEDEEEEKNKKSKKNDDFVDIKNLANFLTNTEIKMAFIKTLLHNQGEAMKIIVDSFPDVFYFDISCVQNILLAGRKCCWNSLKVVFDIIIQKRIFEEKIFNVYMYLFKKLSSNWKKEYAKHKFHQILDDAQAEYKKQE